MTQINFHDIVIYFLVLSLHKLEWLRVLAKRNVDFCGRKKRKGQKIMVPVCYKSPVKVS